MRVLSSDMFDGGVLTPYGIRHIRDMIARGQSVAHIVGSVDGDLPPGGERIIRVFARAAAESLQTGIEEPVLSGERQEDVVAEDVSTIVRPLTTSERARVRELALVQPDLSCHDIAARIGIPNYCTRKMAAYVAYDRRSRKK